MIEDLIHQYSQYKIKQKYYLFLYEEMDASKFLINAQKKLSEVSFIQWLIIKLENKIYKRILK